MLNKNSYKAGLLLGIFSIGYFASYPWRDTLWGGIINSGLAAGMVGGLADWFAVSALFRRPLGITLGTEVIPKNRDKIFTAIVDMIANQLFNVPNLIKAFAGYRFSQAAVTYLDEHGGKKQCKRVLFRLLKEVLPGDDTSLQTFMQQVLTNNIDGIKLTPAVVRGVKWSVERGYDEKVITFAIHELEKIVSDANMKKMIAQIFVNVRREYEQGMVNRHLFNNLLTVFADLSPMEVASAVQKNIIMYLDEVKAHNHPLRKKFKDWLLDGISSLTPESEFGQKIESLKLKAITNLNDSLQLENFASDMKLKRRVSFKIDEFFKKFQENQSQQQKIDEYAINFIYKLINNYHNQIETIVTEKLQSMTNEELVELLERKAGNDLQMIRINGSLVGAFIGMIIYVLNFLIDRVIGYVL